MKNLINYLSKKSLSLGNGSGLTRKWFGNDSGMTRFSLASLICLCMLTIGVGNAWGADGDNAYTLSFSKLTSGTNYNSYGAAHSITVSSKTWSVYGNQSLGTYLAVGGKSLSSTDRTITGSHTIGKIVKQVKVNYSGVTNGKSSSLTLNSAKLEVSGTSDFSKIDETVNLSSLNITSSSDASYLSFTPSGSNWASTKYYRFSFNCTTTGSNNSHFDITSIEFIEGSSGSTPTLTATSSMTTLTYSAGSPVAQSFTIGGSNLTSTVTVSAPTNYEVCKTSGGTYTSSISFTNTEVNAADKTVYIRLQSGLSPGNIASSNVTVASSGATSRTVAVTGTVPYTITWMANGSTYETTYVAVGSTLVLPASDPNPGTYSCAGRYFYGWYGDGSSYSHASSAPTIAAAGDAVSANKTYHAVFADRSGSGAVTWDKVTSASGVTAGTYVIVYDGSYYLPSETEAASNPSVGSGITVSGSSLSNTVTSAMQWTFSGTSSAWTISHTSGLTTYYLGSTDKAQGITVATSNDSYTWTVGNNSSPYSGIHLRGAGTTRFLTVYSSSSWRYYTDSGDEGDVALYKKSGDGYTWSNYATTCCTDPELAYATGSVTKTYGASVFTNALTNSHSVGVTYDSSDPTVATVNGSGQVTILKVGSTTITASSAAQTVAAVSYCADEASYTLTVNKADISPSLSYSSTTLVIGNNSSSPTVGGNSGSGTVTYAITTESTSGVVTLNTTTGVVTAAKEGTATITATIPATTNYNGGSATANFTVTCGAPSSVDISGNYQFYPGETISLTATPTGGAGTPVTYQWKKGGSPIAGATSATYTKNNATASDAGAYTCTVQYGSNCATTSDAFNLKCMQFYLKNNSGEDISNHALTKVDATHATLSLSLTGGTTYKFRVTDGCGDWYGNSGEMTSSNCTNWAMDADADCRVTTSSKSATYTFNFDFTDGLLGSEMKVSVVYPSSNQASGKVIYWDNEVNKWNGSKLWYRIGKSTHNSNTQLSKVAGTANFYSVTTSQYDGFEYWHIANNVGQGTGNIFWTKDNSGSGLEITNAMGFEGAPVTDATVTVTPTTTHSTGGSSDNNNCEFYTYSITSGVKSYTVTSSATNCTVAMEKYNNDAGSSTTDLASGGTVMPTQYVKVTVTPNTGYQFSSVSVTNGTTVTAAAAGTPGVYYITGNATVTATCTAKTCTVNFDKNSGSGGDASTTATYGLALPTVSVPSRTGYTFDGYWDAETNNNGSGTQYYSANGISARNWDKDVTADQTLYAKWNAKKYTIELDREGAASGATSVTATFDAGTLAGWSAPSKTGYEFGGYWSADNGTGTMVINASGVLQNSVTISAVNWTDASGHWIKDGGVTVYAKWTAEQYTITYKDQGNVAYSGSNGGSLPTTHTYGAVTALVDGVKSGYRFDGWFDNSGCTGSAITTIGGTDITANTTYYAKWTQVYTVTWSVNGETSTEQVVSGEKVASLPTAPTSSDCDDSKVFVGWRATAIAGTSASDPGGIFTNVAGSPTISANMTFYAVFADESGGDNTLVTNVSELTAGTKVYIYAATSDVPAFTAVAKAYASGNNVRATSGSVSNNKLTPGENAGLYTIGEVTVSATKYYTFNDGTYYLRATGTSKNYLVGAAELGDDEKGLFSISISAGVFSITCKNTTVRGVMQFNKNSDTGDYTKAIFACYASADPSKYSAVQLFKKNPYVYSNYVTSCSSCDADATFTNTTPAVSDIDCTSATLTATGGLATVGADGCHVSDYGFVIGTSDNPAIGGSGVTKLQVGTSDPTIGDDFSYDATGLTKGTHYYIRAYAINRHGTAYSSSTNFWTNNVSSIAITTAPTKTNYIVGETFDATGMVVTATMASGATENVTSDVTYSSSALTAGTSQNFAINYTLCETAKSVNQVINVYTLAVTEGANPSYGTATNSSANIVSITGLGDHKTYTVTVTSSNATAVDNGDNTWSIINPTGNVTVRVDYAEAAQVKVYYKVDGVTVTGLTQDVYQSETTTLPTASELATAMTAQSMDLPDDDYPNFVGWSETEFSSQTSEPTIVSGTPAINAEKIYYAVYTNLSQVQIEYSITSGYAAEANKTIDGQTITYGYLYPGNYSGTRFIQFQKNATDYGRIYNSTSMANLIKLEAGYYNSESAIPVYACSAAGTITGSAISAESHEGSDPYVYTFPSNTSYFMVKGDNSTVYKPKWLKIYYCSSTVYYMTQFCTRYTITGASTSGTAVIVNGNTGGTLTSSHNELCEGKSLTLSATVNTQYSFGEWKIVKTGSDPEVDLTADLLGANKTSLTPPAFSMPGYGITVSATISEKTATAWSWTYNSASIPDPMILYVGEVKQLDVTYTPDAAQLVAAQKNYSVDKESSVAQVSKTADYYKMRGAAGVTVETNTTVTFNLNSLSQVVNMTVRPLPSATFEDNVHNAISTTVTATISDGVVSLTKKTPTHADISPVPASGNSCEKTHLHLVGWIDGDWEPFINYMNGGSRPSDSDITSATGYFYLPNADIDLSQKGGKTYYAVWGKVDE